MSGSGRPPARRAGACIRPGRSGTESSALRSHPDWMGHDLVGVGAGPAGIPTAVEALEAGIASGRILVQEKGPVHAYAIRKYYRDSLNRPMPPPRT